MKTKKKLEHMRPTKAQLNTRILHGNLDLTIGQLTEDQAKLALHIREKQVIKLMSTLENIWSKAERAFMNI